MGGSIRVPARSRAGQRGVGSGRSAASRIEYASALPGIGVEAAQQGVEVGRGEGSSLRVLQRPQVHHHAHAGRCRGRRAVRSRPPALAVLGGHDLRAIGPRPPARPSAGSRRRPAPRPRSGTPRTSARRRSPHHPRRPSPAAGDTAARPIRSRREIARPVRRTRPTAPRAGRRTHVRVPVHLCGGLGRGGEHAREQRVRVLVAGQLVRRPAVGARRADGPACKPRHRAVYARRAGELSVQSLKNLNFVERADQLGLTRALELHPKSPPLYPILLWACSRIGLAPRRVNQVLFYAILLMLMAWTRSRLDGGLAPFLLKFLRRGLLQLRQYVPDNGGYALREPGLRNPAPPGRLWALAGLDQAARASGRLFGALRDALLRALLHAAPGGRARPLGGQRVRAGWAPTSRPSPATSPRVRWPLDMARRWPRRDTLERSRTGSSRVTCPNRSSTGGS